MSVKLLRGASLSVLMASLSVQSMSPAFAQDVSPPKTMERLPITATSRPYMAAADARTPIDLPARGYAEEEMLFSGTANIYAWQPDRTVGVRAADAPYTSRLLIRRPVDPAKFSGTVWVEFLNPVHNNDFSTSAWGYANYYMMDNGDAWIGISAADRSFKTLKAFDPVRYGKLAMTNPFKGKETCEVASGVPYSADVEDGLRWDILSQVGAALKSQLGNRPLAELNVKRAYVMQQSGGDMPAYLAAFANRAVRDGGKPIWDGYLMKDSGPPTELNQCDPRLANDDSRRVLRNLNAPVIHFIVEDGVFLNYFSRREDSDAPGDRYRRYEVAGSAHVDPYVGLWMPSLEIANRVGINRPSSCYPERQQNDFPIHYYTAGAMRFLDNWVSKGVAPPKEPRLELVNPLGEDKHVPRDRFGNGLGGVRTAFVDVPSSAYNQPGPCAPRSDIGVAYDWQTMEAIYGSYDNFTKLRAAAVDRDVAKGWLPAAYADRVKAGKIQMPTADAPALAGDIMQKLREERGNKR